MLSYALEILNMLLLFLGVLGYKFRTDWRLLSAGIVVLVVYMALIIFFPEAFKLNYYLGIAIPAVTIPLFVQGRELISFGIAFCLMRVFSMLDFLFFGIWILAVKGDAMEVDLVGTYILGELTCAVIFALLTVLLGERRERIRVQMEKIHPLIFLPFVACSILLNYNPYVIGDAPQELSYIVYAKGLLKNGALTIGMILVFVLTYIMVIQRKELRRAVLLNDRCIKEQAEQYRRVSQEDLKLRKFRHDYNAHLVTLQAIAADGDVGRMRDYVASLTELKSESSLARTNNLVCDAILSNYVKQCETNSVDLMIHGKFPQRIEIADTDLCVLVSNGMKNAYEAAQKCRGSRRILFDIGNMGVYMMISITNTADEKLVERDGHLLTTKQDRKYHGLGTQNMQETAKRNGGHVSWHMTDEGEVVTEIWIRGKESI